MNTSIKNAINVSTLESIKEAMEKIEEKKVLKLVNYAIREGTSQAQIIEAIQKVWIRLAIYLKKENTELRI